MMPEDPDIRAMIAGYITQIAHADELISILSDALNAVFEETGGTSALSDTVDEKLQLAQKLVEDYRLLNSDIEPYDDDDMGDD